MHEKMNELLRFHRNVEYFRAHHDQLLEQYPEQWVAVLDERVVAADSDYERLLKFLKANGVPLGKVYIQRATETDEPFILVSGLGGTSSGPSRAWAPHPRIAGGTPPAVSGSRVRETSGASDEVLPCTTRCEVAF